ncbi:MAG: ABC transporter permease [bacterium]
MSQRIKLLIRYRELLGLLVRQSLALRYRHTILGFFWSLLSPVATMAIMAVVFHFIIRIDMANYTVFLFSAMLPWSFFAATLAESSISILHKQDLITRQPIPKLVLPLSMASANLVNLLLSVSVLIVLVGPQLGVLPSMAWVYLPLAFACLFAFSIGLGAIVAVTTVYLRDVNQIVTVVLPAWMYASPVLYPLELPSGEPIIPVEYQPLFKLNPIYWILQLFVRPIYWGVAPDATDLAMAIGISSTALVVGFAFFWWKEDDLVFHL